jgi:hypothetical protein
VLLQATLVPLLPATAKSRQLTVPCATTSSSVFAQTTCTLEAHWRLTARCSGYKTHGGLRAAYAHFHFQRLPKERPVTIQSPYHNNHGLGSRAANCGDCENCYKHTLVSRRSDTCRLRTCVQHEAVWARHGMSEYTKGSFRVLHNVVLLP